MIKRRIFTFILCSACFGLSAQMVADKIIAQVGNQIILLSELETQFQYELERTPNAGSELKCSILEGLLIEKVLLTYAELDSVDVSSEMVEQQLELRMNQILRMMNNDSERLEEFYGQSVVQLKNRVRNEMRNQMLIQGKQEQIVGNVKVTPAEVIAFHRSMPVDSLPLFASEVEVAEILVHAEVSEEEKEKARNKLLALKERIEAGEDFAEIARIFSDDPGSSRTGGDLGMLGRGMLVPAYEAAAFSVEEGDLTEIVESSYGFHLIQLMERRGNNYRTRHILIKPEITKADLEKAREDLREVKYLIDSDSLSFEAAVKKYSDESIESFTNGGRIRNPKTGNTFFEIGDLEPPDIFFTIDTMEVGEVSAPIEFREVQSDTYYRLIKLQSRTEPHRANLTQDYAKLQEFAKTNKRNGAIAKWIDDKVQEIYIRLDDEFINCSNLQNWNIRGRTSGGS